MEQQNLPTIEWLAIKEGTTEGTILPVNRSRRKARACPRDLGLRWLSTGADYLDANGDLFAHDPTAHESRPTALLLRKEFLERCLREQDLTLYWVILGEKWVVGENARDKYHGGKKVSGTYRLTQDGPVGPLNCVPDLPKATLQTSEEVKCTEDAAQSASHPLLA